MINDHVHDRSRQISKSKSELESAYVTVLHESWLHMMSRYRLMIETFAPSTVRHCYSQITVCTHLIDDSKEIIATPSDSSSLSRHNAAKVGTY